MTEFRVWAPRPERVRLDVEGALHPMTQSDDGWWRAEVDTAPDARYGYVLDDDPTVLPDPRSPRQPDGVHARSQLWQPDPDAWRDGSWAGRSIEGAVIYELHVGTFTPEGTFDSAIGRLDHLVDLGVDFVELMPVNAFGGTHGWGYDGVLWYAVHEPYGGPDGLVRLVNACHERGLGVLIDAVFNHLGPSGNYMPRFGPYLSSGSNPWGESINISGPDADEVRRHIIDCALRWMREFHADGLRLDAVHALVDTTAIHILEELSAETDALAVELGRPLSLIAESDLNDPRLITPRDRGGLGMTAQWDDDIHHAIHSAVSGERQGYYRDFGTLEALAVTLRNGYFHAGTYSSFRHRRHGRPLDTATIPATRLLAYTLTHDQVGNRAVGDRPSQNLTFGQLAVKAALALGSPYTAMLFMGEEWGSSSPFQFFSSHPEPELARATAEGRKREFAEHGWDADEIPDPQDPQTFLRSKLVWDELGDGEHARLLSTYKALIALRRTEPDLADPWLDHLRVDYDEQRRWIVMHRGAVAIACNLGADPVEVPVGGRLLLAWGEPAVSAESTRLDGHSFAIVKS
ncbi:malto-oligosyltrehalose trehalohydrolase [Mycolicibacterium phlei]|jgi:maltooligosyltrehalose trehalohydrolase|uniref:Malto-oligosyltrehalose trehalohydrolase n=1 Tax=Mycolicibacterium phlei DSM 43239 = CCUG 21000 TaxID=1226750 RepID=A0A5N5V9A1_MYCPH|nr:malto-oligosyltrehalose trehalohydrolase [Mycolicibacterium phlei]VEG09750.1 malto-oligosyltrehalose trehalohydrolase [Mycobacteroides chelonae]EID18130.1 malto-oligosyltrehalose trehalohydrolase [Mycolicibacterium phlei RIVM601174]KAB7757537.1 malto-oligosyltrehalose trehalohydrolase [Mycolicibacterium phlei DSM 43239 = CCUG 21000]KXW64069.1 malto-oligosyltrehalose trehalohydrolase [Mycolicibacterium phlei DSM 43070]KXW67733.1 malto-oligosyltrehalose trehalohydrolase [Mycolicibacterium phl